MIADSFLRSSALFLATLVLGTCLSSASDAVTITKVNPFHLNDRTAFSASVEPMIEFEPRRLLRGAVSLEEQQARYGHYFNIFWKTTTRNPATVRFYYRQGATGSQVLTKETLVSAPKRRNVTKFEVIGDEYSNGGKVTQWKVSILEAGAVVAEFKSFLRKE